MKTLLIQGAHRGEWVEAAEDIALPKASPARRRQIDREMAAIYDRLEQADGPHLKLQRIADEIFDAGRASTKQLAFLKAILENPELYVQWREIQSEVWRRSCIPEDEHQEHLSAAFGALIEGKWTPPAIPDDAADDEPTFGDMIAELDEMAEEAQVVMAKFMDEGRAKTPVEALAILKEERPTLHSVFGASEAR